MKYEFACTNIMQDCPEKVSGDTEEEVMKAASDHAREAHGVAHLADDDRDRVRAAIAPLP